MKRRRLWLLVLVSCCVAVLVAGVARAADDFIPSSPPDMVTWSKAPLYDRYPVWNYVYGGRLQGADTYYRLYYLMNMVQVGKAWYLKLGIRSVEYALRFDAVTQPVQMAGKTMNGLVGALWSDSGRLVTTGLLVAAVLAVWLWFWRGRQGQALRLLGGVTVVLVASYVIFAVAPGTLVTCAGVARALGGQVFSAVAAVAAPAGTEGTAEERLLRSAGENAWDAFVYEPWLDGEFTAGAPDKAAYKDDDLPGGKWLAMTPTDRVRRYTIMDPTTQMQDFHQWDQTFIQDYLPRRLMLAFVSGATGFVYGTALLILAGGVIFYQLLLLVILALSPLWLLLALWHPAGMRVVRGAVLKGAGALVAQVVLLSVLAVWLAMTGPVLELGSALGWFGQTVLLTLFGVALCRYRFAWLGWGRAPAVSPGEAPAWAPWPVRVFRRREAPGAEVRRAEPAPAAAAPVVLPQFRAAVLRPAEEQVSGPPVREPAGEIPAAVLDLTAEMRRLRSRFGEAGGAEGAAEHRAGLLQAEAGRRAVAAAEAGRGAPRGAETPGPGTVAGRVRPQQGQAIDQYRNR